MKKNIRNNIVQKGGLMIEALAMLGLIAVVTPTMYKKSAERTLEVEDINTADTVRSYMGAAEAYMAANYRNLIKEMTEDADGNPLPPADQDTVREVEWSDIQPYMPYGFNNGKALYDYNSPKIAIVRQGTNLTAFALFPAKSAGGLGQERTSRIASLIGANGGYVKADKSAHGIGGVWNLSSSAVKDVFGSNENNEFSLVTASSNVINSTSGAGAVENTKYLQRTAENTDEKWRNAMRTDLYMGGGDGENDPDDRDNIGNHNILNINSLIVGAEKDMAHLGEAADTANAQNGLYIKPDGTNPNAYIGGSLTALVEKYGTNYAGQFVVEKKGGEGFLYFGQPTITTTDNGDGTSTTNKEYPFRVAGNKGKVSNWGDVSLAEKLESGRTVEIGNYGNEFKINNANPTQGKLFYGESKKGTTDAEKYATVSILGEEMFQLTTDNKEIDNGMDKVGGTHVMIEKNGYKGADKSTNGKDSAGNDIAPSYTKDQTFPVVIGSNAMVKGVLAAGQVDAQHLRTASFNSGAEHIDDQYKWLVVDKDGIVMQDIKTKTVGEGEEATTSRSDGTYVRVNSEGVLMRTDGSEDGASLQLKQSTENSKTYGDITAKGKDITIESVDDTEGAITAKNDNVGMQLKGHEIKIGNPDNDDILIADTSTNIDENPYRVVYGQGGDVDMVGSNFKVMDAKEHNILTIKGNSNKETTDKFGADSTVYNDFNSYTDANNDEHIDYNITTHGNVLFSSGSSKKSSEITSYDQDDTAHFMAIGPDDDKAGVNIVQGESVSSTESASDTNAKRAVFVDLSAANTSANSYVKYSKGGEGVDAALSLASDSGIVGDDHDMHAGTIYVRKGLVEVTPEPGNVSIDATTGRANNAELGANDGGGIIRASRFVANNINKSGDEEKVPEILQSGLLDTYNGTGTVRYDTYMVNPAYTSVMKDIKLTTRGGARLSDILPDFITKGIYLAGNTYDDTKQDMRFKLKADEFKLVDEPTETVATTTTSSGKYTSNNWASPYSGLVPAPQCPPGYGRVVTINPYAFEVAQAGQLALSADAGDSNSAGYYINTTEMTNKLSRASYSHAKKEELENELLTKTPGLHQLNVEWNSGSMNAGISSGFSADGKPVTGSGTISVSSASGLTAGVQIPIYTTNTTGEQGDGSDHGSTSSVAKSSYVLAASEKGMRPLSFQQSTWFHTEAVPVVPSSGEMGDVNGTYVGYEVAGKYVRGWAILQGFLYHYNEYKNFACPTGEDCKELSPIANTDENEVLWNLFPVAKNSIHSYVSTYCYFDRTNMFQNYQNTDETIKSIERMDILNEVPYDYEKGVTGNAEADANRKTYYENLNDPTMKYNEVW